MSRKNTIREKKCRKDSLADIILAPNVVKYFCKLISLVVKNEKYPNLKNISVLLQSLQV
jgi:hypothetical protein